MYKNTLNESTGSGSYVAVSLSPDVDSEKLTPEKTRENSTSNPILFLQKGIYTDVVKKLSSKSIKPWLKDCGLKPASTLVTNKKILLGHIEGAIAGDTTLSAQFIGRLTKNMNDSAILTELFNFGINEKENARARKTQLQSYLIDHFAKTDTIASPEKSASRLKSRQAKRLRKSLHNQLKVKRKIDVDVNIEADPEEVPENILLSKESTSNSDMDTTTVPNFTPNSESLEADPEEVPENILLSKESTSNSDMDTTTIPNFTPNGESLVTKTKLEEKNSPNAVTFTKAKESGTETVRSNGKNSKPVSKKPKTIYAHDASPPSTDMGNFEKPWKTLEANIIELKDKTCRHEQLLQQILTNTSVSDCGLTKIEVSELLEKVSRLEKDNSTLIKTQAIQQGSLNYLSNLESEIKELKEDMRIIRNYNKDLTISNSKLEKEFQSLRDHLEQNALATTEDIANAIKEKDAAKKKKKKKKQAKNTQTEPGLQKTVPHGSMTISPNIGLHNQSTKNAVERGVNHDATKNKQNGLAPGQADSATYFSFADVCSHEAENVTTESRGNHPSTGNRIGTTSTECSPPTIMDDILGNKNLSANEIRTSEISRPLKSNNEPKTKSTVPPAQSDERSWTTKEPKTRSTVPPTVVEKLPSYDGYIVSGNHGGETESNIKIPSHSKKRCLLIHDDFHEDFDISKFSQRYEVKCHKMPLLSNVKNEMRTILHKIKETKSELVFLHAGHKDLWIGNKTNAITTDFKQIISWLLERSEAKVCVSLIIPGDGQYRKLDEEVSTVNRFISDHITSLRKDSKNMNRIFTANNNRLREFMSKSIGPQGTQLTLSNRGKKLLYLKMRDSIERSLQSTPNVNEPVKHKHTEGRQTYRRDLANYPNSRQRNSSQNENKRR